MSWKSRWFNFPCSMHLLILIDKNTLSTKLPQTVMLFNHLWDMINHVMHVWCNNDGLHISWATARHGDHVLSAAQCLPQQTNNWIFLIQLHRLFTVLKPLRFVCSTWNLVECRNLSQVLGNMHVATFLSKVFMSFPCWGTPAALYYSLHWNQRNLWVLVSFLVSPSRVKCGNYKSVADFWFEIESFVQFQGALNKHSGYIFEVHKTLEENNVSK